MKYPLQVKKIKKINYDRSIYQIAYNKNYIFLLKNLGNDKTQSIFLGPYLVIEDLGTNIKILVYSKEKSVHKTTRTRVSITHLLCHQKINVKSQEQT